MRDINWAHVLIGVFAALLIAAAIFFILDNALGEKAAEFKSVITNTKIVITSHTSTSNGRTTTRTDTNYYIWIDDIEFGMHKIEVNAFQYFKLKSGEEHIFSMKKGKFTKLEYYSLVR